MLQFAEQLFGIMGLNFTEPVTVGIAFRYLADVCLSYLIVMTILGGIKAFSMRFMGGKL